ncbi:MAG: DUF4365 domain-containing protein [Flavobacteriales bacterium]|nr:DUF4365 domain-containing protein [Flavobacteriales bacterium]
MVQQRSNLRKRSTQEIERAANILMVSVLDAHFRLTKSELRPNEHHNERGIDFSIEVQRTTVQTTEGLPDPASKRTLFIQNKGTDNKLYVRVQGPNKGFIAYPIDKPDTLSYLAEDHDNVCLITVCDLTNKSVYWCPIQIDYNRYVEEINAIKNGSRTKGKNDGSIQIRIDPKRCLWKNGKAKTGGLGLLLKDVEVSAQLIFTRQLQERNRSQIGEDAVAIVVDHSKPLLEQLYHYMMERFGELHHMPSEFFTRSYPFRLSDSFHPWHDQFTLTIDNENLVELFQAVKINELGKLECTDSSWIIGVTKPLEKIRYILRCLSASHVFYIVGHKSRKWARVYYNVGKQCACVRCQIERMDFRGAFDAMSAGVGKTNNLQLMAYSHYKVGNFIESAELLEVANVEHGSNHEWSQHVLASYSLSKLRTHLRTNYWGKQSPTALIERLAMNDVTTIRMSLPKDKNSRFHEWVDKGRFHSETMYELYKTVSKIRDHYHSQLQGGWSSNGDISDLIKEFADLDEFLSKDFVYFDRFDEYRQIVDVFSEGLFASHAIGGEQKSRLGHFDDWLIKKLAWNSDPGRLLKHFHRHHLHEIQYKSSVSSGEPFVVVLLRILADAKPVAKAFKKLFGKTNTTFIQQYNNLASNLIVFAAISNISPEDVNLIASKLPETLRSNTLLNHGFVEQIWHFIQRKGMLIDKETLKALLLIVPKSEKLHHGDLLSALSKALSPHAEVNLSKIEVQRFIDLTAGKCPLCMHEHPIEWLIPIHRVSNGEGRKLLEQSITSRLRTNFRPELYYAAVMHDVLDLENDFFDWLLIDAQPVADQPSFREAMSGEKDKRRPMLDMFINLCFKEGIDLRHEKFSVLRGFDSYYDWLLDMSGFNYSQFNVKWVAAHQTVHYLNEIRKHGIIKDMLSEYLKNRRDPQMERAFFNLYRSQTEE